MISSKIKKEIAIIGGGSWGSALAQAFVEKCNVTMHVLAGTEKLSDTRIKTLYDFNVAGDYIFLVVPSDAVREVCSKMLIPDKSRAIIICSKGIERSSGKLMSEVVKEFFPANPLAVLGGPNLAHEVTRGLPAITSIASEDIDLARAISAHCSSKHFNLVPSDNIFMVQLFGALKNVIAILCGAARGLQLGENFIGSLISVCAKEIMEIAKHRLPSQADCSIFLEPAGIGDIFLTCACVQSRNNSFGFECVTNGLGTNHNARTKLVTVEGLNTIMALQVIPVQAPLLKSFALALTDGSYKTLDSVRAAFTSLVLNSYVLH